MMLNPRFLVPSLVVMAAVAALPLSAWAAQAKPATPSAPPTATTTALGPVALSGYTIGPDDVLTVSIYNDQKLSGDVTVRPDGLITIQVLNDIQAAGLTPAELGRAIAKAALKIYQDEPSVTVVVKQINSRRVYVMGEVAKTGPFSLTGPMTVAQLISVSGGLADWADEENIMIIRLEGGKQITIPINYKDIKKGKNLAKNNIELRPGDTIIVR